MRKDRSMRILITGASGFIGKNLVVRLRERVGIDISTFTRSDSVEILSELVAKADAIVHLAGETRPADVADFAHVNTDLTIMLCKAICTTGSSKLLIFPSSIKAEYDNPYGQSKLAAELEVEAFARETGNSVVIYRLPGVFGKWCKPNYNSVVATFCYNTVHGLPIQVNDSETVLQLVYIDDLIDEFLRVLDNVQPGFVWGKIDNIYSIALDKLAEQITEFRNCRTNLISERVGTGLIRALYSTYISYLQPEQFVYDLPKHGDERGVFVEMLKTLDSGQFSFFTIRSGVTRGSHYHHTMTEKFLVVSGTARMRFRQIETGETCELTVTAQKPQVVDTIPGWAHDITNIGDCEAVVMLWASEVFDSQKPDCITCKV